MRRDQVHNFAFPGTEVYNLWERASLSDGIPNLGTAFLRYYGVYFVMVTVQLGIVDSVRLS